MPRSPASAADWVEAALARPVAFAQVREDAALDLEVLAACPEGARVAMIASGGCTAAALAANARTGSLLLVDANPAQLDMTRLKLALLKEAPERRARLLAAAARSGAAANPYLSLMTRSRLPPGGALPWMRMPGRAAPPAVEFQRGGMREALEARPGEFDFVHLSNIFDWLAPLERSALLDAARRALKPGGWVLARRLNSDFAPDGNGLEWHHDRAERMTAEDRSAIYSEHHLGRKR